MLQSEIVKEYTSYETSIISLPMKTYRPINFL